MNINLTDLPSPTKLIQTMDRHPIGSVILLCAIALVCTTLLAGLVVWSFLR